MYLQQSRIAVARAHSFYGNANMRGTWIWWKSLQRASQLLWPKIARLGLQLSGASLVGLRSIGLWQAAGELSP